MENTSTKHLDDNPLISIVMPARDAGMYIGNCIDSIIAQTYTNWELIVVDDNSTDETTSIIKTYADRDPRIKLYTNPNSGIISALQLSYAHTLGTHITRMDADDLMSSDKMALMSEALTQNERGHVAVGLVTYFAKDGVGDGYKRYATWLNKLTSSATNFTEIYKECVVPSPCWMMHRADFEMIGGFDGKVYPEDYDLCFRMRNHKMSILPIPSIIHHWRDHGSRASRNDPNYSDNRFLAFKCEQYLNADHDPTRPLVLYGAGKKAKWIAKYLRERNHQLHWLTNNPNKIGHNIYGVVLALEDTLASIVHPKVIIAVANPEEQAGVVRKLEQLRLVVGEDWDLFC